MATLFTSYILWLFGGLLGLHHFYLGRDKQAFVWLCTFGGFGFGWLRDLWRIPDYVEESNSTENFKLEFFRKVQKDAKPPFSVIRFAGELIMGNLFGYLSLAVMTTEFVESDIGNLIATYLPPVASALGVYIVGNIGREQVSFKWCLIGSYCGLLWTYQSIDNVSMLPITATSILRWKGVSWRYYREKPQSIFLRVPKFSFCVILYLSLLISAFYFNAYITDKDDEKVYVRDAINNFFKSPAWEETKDSLQRLYNYYQAHGWGRLWHEIIDALDPKGEKNAYKVLDVSSSASQGEITAKYRKLARQWHPDKHKDPEKKLEAQQKFMEIQNAYDILSDIKTRRSVKNKKSTKNPGQT